MMVHSMFLMVTGGSLMPSTQDPSQGAGHTRPVNSGKLLVWVSWFSASRQSLHAEEVGVKFRGVNEISRELSHYSDRAFHISHIQTALLAKLKMIILR